MIEHTELQVEMIDVLHRRKVCDGYDNTVSLWHANYTRDDGSIRYNSTYYEHRSKANYMLSQIVNHGSTTLVNARRISLVRALVEQHCPWILDDTKYVPLTDEKSEVQILRTFFSGASKALEENFAPRHGEKGSGRCTNARSTGRR